MVRCRQTDCSEQSLTCEEEPTCPEESTETDVPAEGDVCSETFFTTEPEADSTNLVSTPDFSRSVNRWSPLAAHVAVKAGDLLREKKKDGFTVIGTVKQVGPDGVTVRFDKRRPHLSGEEVFYSHFSFQSLISGRIEAVRPAYENGSTRFEKVPTLGEEAARRESQRKSEENKIPPTPRELQTPAERSRQELVRHIEGLQSERAQVVAAFEQWEEAEGHKWYWSDVIDKVEDLDGGDQPMRVEEEREKWQDKIAAIDEEIKKAQVTIEWLAELQTNQSDGSTSSPCPDSDAPCAAPGHPEPVEGPALPDFPNIGVRHLVRAGEAETPAEQLQVKLEASREYREAGDHESALVVATGGLLLYSTLETPLGSVLRNEEGKPSITARLNHLIEIGVIESDRLIVTSRDLSSLWRKVKLYHPNETVPRNAIGPTSEALQPVGVEEFEAELARLRFIELFYRDALPRVAELQAEIASLEPIVGVKRAWEFTKSFFSGVVKMIDDPTTAAMIGAGLVTGPIGEAAAADALAAGLGRLSVVAIRLAVSGITFHAVSNSFNYWADRKAVDWSPEAFAHSIYTFAVLGFVSHAYGQMARSTYFHLARNYPILFKTLHAVGGFSAEVAGFSVGNIGLKIASGTFTFTEEELIDELVSSTQMVLAFRAYHLAKGGEAPKQAYDKAIQLAAQRVLDARETYRQSRIPENMVAIFERMQIFLRLQRESAVAKLEEIETAHAMGKFESENQYMNARDAVLKGIAYFEKLLEPLEKKSKPKEEPRYEAHYNLSRLPGSGEAYQALHERKQGGTLHDVEDFVQLAEKYFAEGKFLPAAVVYDELLEAAGDHPKKAEWDGRYREAVRRHLGSTDAQKTFNLDDPGAGAIIYLLTRKKVDIEGLRKTLTLNGQLEPTYPLFLQACQFGGNPAIRISADYKRSADKTTTMGNMIEVYLQVHPETGEVIPDFLFFFMDSAPTGSGLRLSHSLGQWLDTNLQPPYFVLSALGGDGIYFWPMIGASPLSEGVARETGLDRLFRHRKFAPSAEDVVTAYKRAIADEILRDPGNYGLGADEAQAAADRVMAEPNDLRTLVRRNARALNAIRMRAGPDGSDRLSDEIEKVTDGRGYDGIIFRGERKKKHTEKPPADADRTEAPDEIGYSYSRTERSVWSDLARQVIDEIANRRKNLIKWKKIPEQDYVYEPDERAVLDAYRDWVSSPSKPRREALQAALIAYHEAELEGARQALEKTKGHLKVLAEAIGPSLQERLQRTREAYEADQAQPARPAERTEKTLPPIEICDDAGKKVGEAPGEASLSPEAPKEAAPKPKVIKPDGTSTAFSSPDTETALVAARLIEGDASAREDARRLMEEGHVVEMLMATRDAAGVAKISAEDKVAALTKLRELEAGVDRLKPELESASEQTMREVVEARFEGYEKFGEKPDLNKPGVLKALYTIIRINDFLLKEQGVLKPFSGDQMPVLVEDVLLGRLTRPGSIGSCHPMTVLQIHLSRRLGIPLLPILAEKHVAVAMPHELAPDLLFEAAKGKFTPISYYVRSFRMPEGAAGENLERLLPQATAPIIRFDSPEFVAALPASVRLAALYPEDRGHLINHARASLNSGDLQQAINVYGQVLQRNPRDLDALVGVAEIYYQVDCLADAARYFNAALEIVEARNRLADALNDDLPRPAPNVVKTLYANVALFEYRLCQADPANEGQHLTNARQYMLKAAKANPMATELHQFILDWTWELAARLLAEGKAADAVALYAEGLPVLFDNPHFAVDNLVVIAASGNHERARPLLLLTQMDPEFETDLALRVADLKSRGLEEAAKRIEGLQKGDTEPKADEAKDFAMTVDHPLIDKAKTARPEVIETPQGTTVTIHFKDGEGRDVASVILNPKVSEGEKVLEIESIAVNPERSKELEGRGIATAIAASIFEMAKSNGYRAITLTAVLDGIFFWTKPRFGFQPGTFTFGDFSPVGSFRMVTESTRQAANLAVELESLTAEWLKTPAGLKFRQSDAYDAYLADPFAYPDEFLESLTQLSLVRDLKREPITDLEIASLRERAAWKSAGPPPTWPEDLDPLTKAALERHSAGKEVSLERLYRDVLNNAQTVYQLATDESVYRTFHLMLTDSKEVTREMLDEARLWLEATIVTGESSTELLKMARARAQEGQAEPVDLNLTRLKQRYEKLRAHPEFGPHFNRLRMVLGLNLP